MEVPTKFDEFKRRVNDSDSSMFPIMIQEMIDKKDYDGLVRFGEAFKSRSIFMNTYEARLPRTIHVRDNYDLLAYMTICSDLEPPSHITYEPSIRYIENQAIGRSQKIDGSSQTDQSSVIDSSQIIQRHELVNTEDDFNPFELLMEVCNDEKEEMYENYLGYLNVLWDELTENMALLKKYLSREEMHGLRIFVDSQHEIKGEKPSGIFRALPTEEQIEIVRGKWNKANLFSRTPLYSVFLSMMYTNDVNPPHEICVRHPFLMISYKYLEDLSNSIVAHTKDKGVIRSIVKMYANNFKIDDSSLTLDCLNRLHIYLKKPHVE